MRNPPKRSSSAMTDIAFLLLLFFLILAIIGFQTPAPVTPPYQQHGLQIDDQSCVKLFITKEGQLLDQTGPIDMDMFTQLLQSHQDQPFLISADKDVPFHSVSPILQAMSSYDISHVYFAVETQPEALP